MALPVNELQQVQTYNESNLALLLNQNCFLNTMNTKFKDFQDIQGNLGSTVTYDLPPNAASADGLVASFLPAEQRVMSLKCDQAANVSYSWTSQEFIFNIEDYMRIFAKSYMAELSARIESKIALNAISSVPVMTINNQGQSVPTGALHTESGPYRFYTAGITGTTISPLNSFGQLALMEAQYMETGAPSRNLSVYLPNLTIPSIINSSLTQFVPDRNQELALSWDLGTYKGSDCRYYRSNLLPTHTSGYCGDNNVTLTLVSTNDPTGANITTLTFSGAPASQAASIRSGDLFEFQDGVSGQPNMRYLTKFGKVPSQATVQNRAISDVDATGGGQVTITLANALCSQSGNINQNLNNALMPGMQVKVVPTHRAGLLVVPDSFYLAMPKLNNQTPFPTSIMQDPDTGASIRQYWGTQFGQNQQSMIHDAIWGSSIPGEYCMRVIIPV